MSAEGRSGAPGSMVGGTLFPRRLGRTPGAAERSATIILGVLWTLLLVLVIALAGTSMWVGLQ